MVSKRFEKMTMVFPSHFWSPFKKYAQDFDQNFVLAGTDNIISVKLGSEIGMFEILPNCTHSHKVFRGGFQKA